jgi:hypothetical protein
MVHTPATVSLMASSLKSGVDECASLRRATEERIKRRDEEHAAFLLQPITAETERKYTALIKQRELYEGACNLSWPMYFRFREEHADDVAPLSADDKRREFDLRGVREIGDGDRINRRDIDLSKLVSKLQSHRCDLQ